MYPRKSIACVELLGLQMASSDAADRGGLVDNRLGKNVLKLIHMCFLNKIAYSENAEFFLGRVASSVIDTKY